jgi:hypothetical protein
MGVDIYHSVVIEEACDEQAVAETIAQLAADATYGDPDDACSALTDGMCNTCRANDDHVRRILLAASRAHPESLLTLITTWYVDDDPIETVYFRNGGIQIAPEIRTTEPFDAGKLVEPQPCVGSDFWPNGCGKLIGIEECCCSVLKWKAEWRAGDAEATA